MLYRNLSCTNVPTGKISGYVKTKKFWLYKGVLFFGNDGHHGQRMRQMDTVK